MSQAASVASGLVRVTVASGSRRVDLVLPGAVPVAELVPELARSVGILDASTVYGGYRLIAQDGRQLAGDAGLTIQGVEDGGLLTVTAGIDEEAPRVYDDIVEAMADVVEHELTPWEPAAGRRTALGAAALLLSLGAFALLLQGESLLGGLAAAVLAGLLVVGGIVLARSQQEPEAGVAVSLIAVLYAAVAGLLLAPGELSGWSWPLAAAFFGLPLACAGGAMLLTGVVAVVGLRDGRALVIPGVVVGAVLAACGLLL
jgi:type VII secretion integral membrane protein EccD